METGTSLSLKTFVVAFLPNKPTDSPWVCKDIPSQKRDIKLRAPSHSTWLISLL